MTALLAPTASLTLGAAEHLSVLARWLVPAIVPAFIVAWGGVMLAIRAREGGSTRVGGGSFVWFLIAGGVLALVCYTICVADPSVWDNALRASSHTFIGPPAHTQVPSAP